MDQSIDTLGVPRRLRGTWGLCRKALDISEAGISDNGVSHICLTLRQTDQLESLSLSPVGPPIAGALTLSAWQLAASLEWAEMREPHIRACFQPSGP